jgi:hypothetical protein
MKAREIQLSSRSKARCWFGIAPAPSERMRLTGTGAGRNSPSTAILAWADYPGVMMPVRLPQTQARPGLIGTRGGEVRELWHKPCSNTKGI